LGALGDCLIRLREEPALQVAEIGLGLVDTFLRFNAMLSP
jgi:hypothetical protein